MAALPGLVHRRRRLFSAAALGATTILCLAGSCQLALDGAPCPCRDDGGYTCCPNNRCRKVCDEPEAQSHPATNLTCEQPAATNDEWCWLNPQPHGRRLVGIWGLRGDDFWAVGDEGTILRHQGQRWDWRPRSTKDIISHIWGPSDGHEVWAATPTALLHRKDDDSDWNTEDVKGASHIWGRSASDVWVVTATDARHWDGTSWSTSSFPDMSTMKAIWGTGSGEVWAVGATISTWENEAWKQVPHPPCDDAGALNQIVGTSAKDVWVARFDGHCTMHWNGDVWISESAELRVLYEIHGTSDIGALDLHGNFLRWDGNAWSAVTSYPGDSPISIKAVWASANELWAVGTGALVEHWSSGAWSGTHPVASVTRADLIDVHGASNSDVWSVGREGTIERFDGDVWGPEPSNTSADLNSVWARSKDDVWAVGKSGTILRRSGGHWVATAPSPVETDLTGVWANEDNEVWAVGKRGTILSFDGVGWSAVSSPIDIDLLGIWGSSSADVWAVGGSGSEMPLAEEADVLHWNGNHWESVWSQALTLDEDGMDGTSRSAQDWQWCMRHDPDAWPLGAVAVWGNGPTDVWVATRCSGTLHFDGQWTHQAPTEDVHDVRGIWSAAGSVFAIGNWGKVNVWDGIGMTWVDASLSTQPRLNALWGADPSEVWAVGVDGVILRKRPK